MPINKIFIGTKAAKDLYVGTNPAKLIYVGTNLVHTQPLTVGLVMENVSSVACRVVELDGSVSNTTYEQNDSCIVGYGAKVTFTATAVNGHTISNYTKSVTATSSDTYTFSATRNIYTVTIKNYSNVISYTYNVYTANGDLSSSGSSKNESTVKVEHGGSVMITGAEVTAGYYAIYSTGKQVITSNNKTVSITARLGNGTLKIYTKYLNNNGGGLASKITYAYNNGGLISGSTTQLNGLAVPYGTEVTLSNPDPAVGFTFYKYIVNNVDATGLTNLPLNGSLSGQTFTFNMPAHDVTIEVVFKETTISGVVTWNSSDYIESTISNSLSRTGTMITPNLIVRLNAVSKNTILGSIPREFCPVETVCVTNSWPRDKNVWTDKIPVQIYITNNGQIYASEDSEGKVTTGIMIGGGGSSTTYTVLKVENTTWSAV